jgi:hypothetical protein
MQRGLAPLPSVLAVLYGQHTACPPDRNSGGQAVGAVLPHHTCYPAETTKFFKNLPPGCCRIQASRLPTAHPPSSATSLPRSVGGKHAGAIAGRDDPLPLPGKLVAA